MTKREAKDLGWRCLTLYLPLILFLIGTLFPFYWIVNTSLKDSVEVLSLPIQILARQSHAEQLLLPV